MIRHRPSRIAQHRRLALGLLSTLVLSGGERLLAVEGTPPVGETAADGANAVLPVVFLELGRPLDAVDLIALRATLEAGLAVADEAVWLPGSAWFCDPQAAVLIVRGDPAASALLRELAEGMLDRQPGADEVPTLGVEEIPRRVAVQQQLERTLAAREAVIHRLEAELVRQRQRADELNHIATVARAVAFRLNVRLTELEEGRTLPEVPMQPAAGTDEQVAPARR